MTVTYTHRHFGKPLTDAIFPTQLTMLVNSAKKIIYVSGGVYRANPGVCFYDFEEMKNLLNALKEALEIWEEGIDWSSSIEARNPHLEYLPGVHGDYEPPNPIALKISVSYHDNRGAAALIANENYTRSGAVSLHSVNETKCLINDVAKVLNNWPKSRDDINRYKQLV